MKFVEYSFPELEDAAGFNAEDDAILIDEITALTTYQNDLLQVLLEKKVLEVYERHADKLSYVEKVIVDAKYQYNDEGYALKNAMVWINNWEDPSTKRGGPAFAFEAEFQKDLDESLELLAPLLTRVSEINIYELEAKFRNQVPEIKPEENKAVTARSEVAQDEVKKPKKHYPL